MTLMREIHDRVENHLEETAENGHQGARVNGAGRIQNIEGRF